MHFDQRTQRALRDAGLATDEVVELALGPTVHDRVRFAGTRESL